MEKKYLLALLAVLLPACTQTINTHGQVILPSRLAQVKPGETTKDELLQLLGSPSAQGTLDDKRWYYITSTVGTEAFRPHDLQSRKVVIIDFDPTGEVVAGVTQKNQYDGKDLDPDGGVTPTHGQSMGFLEQMFGNLGVGK